jgi:transcriptional regulator with XRE-family HTH domain
LARISIDLLAQRPRKNRRKQIQPASGTDRAFGEALRQIRESKKISQERLALEGGFDCTYISLIERGINSPTIRMVVRIAGILNVPASKIVRHMEDPCMNRSHRPANILVSSRPGPFLMRPMRAGPSGIWLSAWRPDPYCKAMRYP